MAKDKKSSKAAAVAPKPAASKTEKVKAGRVTKPAETAKKASKDTAKKTAKAVEKKSKKKEPTPEPSSSEEDDSTSASSDSSDAESDSESEVEAPKANGKVNGAAKAAAKKADSDSDSASSDSSDSSDSEEEAPAPKADKKAKVNGAAKKAAKESDSDSDSGASSSASDSEEEVAPKANGKVAAAATSDSEDESSEASEGSSSDSESDEEPDAKSGAQLKADAASDSSSDSSDSEEEEKPKAAEKPSNKRKAEEAAAVQTPKKTKMDDGQEITGNLFCGNLSWNVDEDWLTREFEPFGELSGVRIITDRDSGRSKGFGYVEFVNADHAAAALEAKQGAQIDGRNIRLDYSTGRQNQRAGQGQTPQQRQSDRAARYGDVPNEPSSTIFVGNISFDATQDMVYEMFQEYGTINGVRLPTDRESGNLKGFGYVEMGSIDEAKAALESLTGAELAGRPIRLDYSTPKPAGDRDGGRGGGFGGGRGGRGGRGGGRGGFDRGRGGRGGRGGGRGGSTNRGGFGDFSGTKKSFD